MEVKSWKYCNLSDVSNKIGSGVTPRGGEKVYQKSGHPLVRSQNVGWGVLLLKDIAYINSDIHESMRSTKLELGDVLLNITGASIGRSAVVDSSIVDGNVNQHVCIIRTKETEVNPYYLNQYLISHYGQKQIESFQSGGNRQGLNIAQIHTFKIPLPPLQEQQKIAAILSKWDELIETQTQLIYTKEKQKTSLMQKLLTGEVRFPGFEDEDIIEGVLSDFVGLKHGYQFRKEDFVQNGIPVIKIGNVIGQNLSFEGVTYISETRLEKFRDFQIYNGDLLMSLTGNIGRVVEVQNLDIPVVQNYRVGKFYSLSEEVLSRDFLKYLLSSPTLLNQLLSYANQSAQANFGKQDMDKLSVTFPANTSEQKKVGGLLNKCDLELQSLKDELEALKRQKKGLMQHLLTGKIRVKN